MFFCEIYNSVPFLSSTAIMQFKILILKKNLQKYLVTNVFKFKTYIRMNCGNYVLVGHGIQAGAEKNTDEKLQLLYVF